MYTHIYIYIYIHIYKYIYACIYKYICIRTLTHTPTHTHTHAYKHTYLYSCLHVDANLIHFCVNWPWIRAVFTTSKKWMMKDRNSSNSMQAGARSFLSAAARFGLPMAAAQPAKTCDVRR